MKWAAKYLGIPYVRGGCGADGADCWGLVRLVLRDERGLDMPALSIGQTGNALALRRCFAGWQAADLRQPAEFDIVTMRNAHGHHVGIVADTNGVGAMLLHCDEPQSHVMRLSLMQQFGYRDFRAWRYCGWLRR